MGLFGAVSSTWSKAQAAATVQGLLEYQAKHGLLDGSPVALANHLVAHVWAQKPDLFEGKTGPKPHKVAVAAIALANGMDLHASNEALQISCLIALGEVLKELSYNGHHYPFHHVDHQLLNASVEVFAEKSEELERSPLSDLPEF